MRFAGLVSEHAGRSALGAAAALAAVLLGATSIASAAADRAVLDLINQQRAANGCDALAQRPELVQAAQWHAEDLAVNGWRNNHIGSDGSQFWERINAAGHTGYTSTAENQAQNYSAEGVVTAWMNSPGHRDNLLNCAFTQAGVASAWSNGTMYTVADFTDR